MKTIITTIITLAISILLLGTTPTTKNTSEINCEFIMEDEKYIDDIPFSTDQVINDNKQFSYEDEEYIDDIPFNTDSIVKKIWL